jgi:uncharacterized protein YdaT
MPWSMGDAPAFTKKATTPKLKSTFAKTANAVLKKTGDEGKAVKIANAAVKKGVMKKAPKAGVVLGQEKRKQKLASVRPSMMNKASFG